MPLDSKQQFIAEQNTEFVDVIVPVAMPNIFTYRLLREHEGLAQIGARLIVPFGKNKIVTAVVTAVHHTPPANYAAKYALEILDENPFFQKKHIDFMLWMSAYYMCNPGDVLNVALPSGLRISSLSKVQYNPDFESHEILTEKEVIVVELLQNQSLTYEEIARVLEIKNAHSIIKNLIAKKAVVVFEELSEKYSPKMVTKIKLANTYNEPENLRSLIGILESSKKIAQIDIILKYLAHVPVLKNNTVNTKGLDKAIISQEEGLSASALNTLIKNGVFEVFKKRVSRFPALDQAVNPMPVLSENQQEAFKDIKHQFTKKNTVLLHGVTGSGKTEVYIKLIQDALDGGTQVLYLLPEIALTTQILQRLQAVFGDKVGVYHSKFSDNERVEVWQGIAEGRISFVVGVRSAIFLPFDSLGLIIIDEEHEASFKQFEPSPRYHARDSALVLAQKHGAKVLLGSATPSFESMYNAKTERYGFVSMYKRFGDNEMPAIELVNSKLAKQLNTLTGEYTELVLTSIDNAVAQKEQVILFQNRRGYAPTLECEVCDWIGKCHRCDVSLTYHYKGQELRCHYCGHHETLPKVCPKCGTGKLKTKGFGTQKLEDDMAVMFPKMRIVRIDTDTTRTKTAFQTIIDDVEKGNVDLLVGTQMLSKGLDFERVNLVCIFDADRLLYFPDFRAAERTFQLLTQVAGRAGRRVKQGKVLIQTKNPENLVLQKVVENDFLGLYEQEIAEREKYAYPPFFKLIRFTFKHQFQNDCYQTAQDLAKLLVIELGESRVIGPEKPTIDRIRDKFIFVLMIKFERNANLTAVKKMIQEKINDIYSQKEHKNTRIIVDVDPMN